MRSKIFVSSLTNLSFVLIALFAFVFEIVFFAPEAMAAMGFACGMSSMADSDGNLYSTDAIGSQCWMKSDLMTTKYPDGTAITRGPVTATWDGTDHGYYAYPPNTANNAEETLANIKTGNLGFLYQWNAAMHGSTTPGVQGVCPSGWHVPTHDEFTTLERTVCNSGSSGTCATDFPFDNNTSGKQGTDEGSKLSLEISGGTNSSGFTGHLTGYRDITGGFFNRSSCAAFWSSSESISSYIWVRFLSAEQQKVDRIPAYKPNTLSVRCVYNTPLLVNGSCGSANGTTVSSAPASNLCATGTASAVTGAGAWSWSCLGSSGGSTAVCGAITSNFTCGTSTLQDIDVNTYSTVTIGSQCWLKENMMTTKYPDGTSIARGLTTASWDGNDNGYFAYPSNTAKTAEEKLGYIQSGKLGFVYQWSAAMHGSVTPGAQGICPSGWHVPTHDEFTTLERFVCTSWLVGCDTAFPFNTSTVGMRGTNEGSKLSLETSGGNNSSGFTGHLAGVRSTTGSFDGRSSFAYFWSSSPSGGSAWGRDISSGYTSIGRSTPPKADGFSVRCLKVGNNCAANTCVGQTCDNTINPLTPGTKAPTYSSYNCAETDAAINAFCAVSSNCGLNITTTSADFACMALSSCTNSTESRPTAECTDQSIPCPSVPKTIQCPGCALKINQGGFTEVAPQVLILISKKQKLFLLFPFLEKFLIFFA